MQLIALVALLCVAHPSRLYATAPATVTAATCPPSISFGETIQCSIVATEVDSYTFIASPGDIVIARAGAAGSALRPALRILTPGGTSLCNASNPYGSMTEIAACALTTSGTFTVQISDTSGTRTGSYGLHLQRLNGPGNTSALDVGQTTTGSILIAAEMDAYSFSGHAGDRVVIRMGTSSGTLRPLLRLYRNDGVKVCEGGNPYGTAGELGSCALTQSGTYTLLVSDYGDVRTGTYGLHFQVVSRPANATALSFAQSTVAAILSAGEIDTYTIAATSSATVLLRGATTDGTLRPHLRIYGAEGTLICEAGVSYSDTAEISSCVLGQPGTYTLLVNDHSDVRTGTYGLYLQRLTNPVNPKPLAIGQHTSGMIGTAGALATYTFTVPAQSVLTARAGAANSSLRPYLRVYTPHGNKVCEAGTSYSETTEISTCALTDGGTYTLLVSDYGGPRTGNYGLQIQIFKDPISAPTLTSGRTLTTAIGAAGAFHTYTFTATAGDNLFLRASVTNGTLRPHMRVYTDSGAKLCEAGTSYGAIAEIPNCTVPSTGRFVVIISDYGTSRTGTYTIFFQNLTSPDSPLLHYAYVPIARY
jgi:hypothetical protein